MTQNGKESPGEKREKLRQEELKNLSSSIQGSNLSDLVAGLTWKGTTAIIIVLIIMLLVFLFIK